MDNTKFTLHRLSFDADALKNSKSRITCTIDGIVINLSSIYVDNFDEQEHIDDGDIIWYADIEPCDIEYLTINGKRIDHSFHIDGGEVRGIINIDGINETINSKYKKVDKIPEKTIKDYIKNGIQMGVSFYVNGNVYEIFDETQLEQCDFYPDDFVDIICGEERSYIPNDANIYYARITSSAIVNALICCLQPALQR